MDFPSKSISNRVLSVWSFIMGTEGLFALYFLIREPSEAENVFAFDLSLQLLLIAISIFFIVLFFWGISIAHFYRFVSWNEFLNTRQALTQYILSGTLFLTVVLLQLWLLLPDYHSPTLSGYLTRLRPVLAWFTLIFAQTFVFLVYFRGLPFRSLKNWRNNVPIFIGLITTMVTWGVIVVTKIGLVPDDFYWNMAGVPLLAGQIWAAVGAILVSWLLHNRIFARVRIPSPVIFIGIWFIAALIWIKTPLSPTFNAPGPYLPAKEFYPFVDAALYDLSAQSAIYGNGINFGAFIDRGLLMGFLAILHMLFGQNYLVVVGVQSAIFASFPALLYLLGKSLHSKAVGLMAAMLAIFKVANAIYGGKWIGTSHPKLMLTEFPTGIVLVLFSLFLVKWIKRNNANSYALISAGASIGIGILLRQNVLFMVPVVLVLGAIAIWRQHWKRAIRDIFLFVAVFFITISPWMWRNQRISGEPLFFLPHFNRVIEQRYQPQSNVGQNRLPVFPSSRALKTSAMISSTENNSVFEQYQFIPKHFAHNIITSVLVLPPSPVLDDLRHIVDKYPYWDRMANPWQGQISFSMGFFLAVNLVILSIGFGAAWKRVRFAALVPLAVFLFYNLANAFARTSGGRYIVPTDWVVYFYYAIGLIEIIRFCISMLGFHYGDFFVGRQEREKKMIEEKFNWGKAGLTILPFFLIVAALPAIEFMSPGDTSPKTNDAIIQKLNETSFFNTSRLSQSEIDEFLNNPDAVLISGHGFYPRYYSFGQGEPILPGMMTVYTARDYPRLVFTLLLPNTDKPVLLPIDEPRLYFPDAAEVIVGGCQVGKSKELTSYLNYIDAAFIVILDESEVIYTRVPEAPLECPLREPVCDNNHNCN